MIYNDILNTIADRMGQSSAKTKGKPTIKTTQINTNDLLNKIGLEVQRQGGAQ